MLNQIIRGLMVALLLAGANSVMACGPGDSPEGDDVSTRVSEDGKFKFVEKNVSLKSQTPPEGQMLVETKSHSVDKATGQVTVTTEYSFESAPPSSIPGEVTKGIRDSVGGEWGDNGLPSFSIGVRG